MCNRYRMSASQADLARRYGIEVPYPEDESYPPGELFPDKPAWVVREEEGRRILDVMSWGVPTQVPGKRIDKVTGKPAMLTKSVTNVRNLNSPFWRSMLDKPSQRCLVPVTTFSEYGQVRGEDGRLPLHWFDVPSRPIFSFAGIWRPSTAGITFAFLTCEPNSVVGPIHPKAMPVILDDEDEQRWLNGAPAAELAQPYPAQLMTIDR
ncbi:SOS response-associated peptidase [Sphingomonas sp. Leaf33]|uniref:SOS response-associated peptidase n=1 Tax=Sphingomonas sp. Leaf33 TaxID=1736215 RepID=UPI0009EC4FC5|nr:SOS response-associated peptidase family protein [Sphingomonas sp. Leaf33]